MYPALKFISFFLDKIINGKADYGKIRKIRQFNS